MHIFKRLFQRDFGVLAGGLVQQLLCNHIRPLIKRNFCLLLDGKIRQPVLLHLLQMHFWHDRTCFALLSCKHCVPRVAVAQKKNPKQLLSFVMFSGQCTGAGVL